MIGGLAAFGGYALQAGSRAVTAIRDTITLPKPTATATVPPSAELDIEGLSPVVTPNAQFYRIDTALAVPAVDPSTWSLRIHGMVDQEVTLTWDELLALPLEESATTLACVSNEVGGGLIGNAVWLGYPVRELLARAAPTADADMVLSRSVDGFTASTPLAVLEDDRNAILAIGMNGDPLPPEHGFPVRMVVPGLYGYVSATKWVVDLEVTRFDLAAAYWTDRGWSERGPIKISSRIDVPRSGQTLSEGPITVAGVAWHQHVGIESVDVQVDDGPWQPATLATAISIDTWVQWRFDWDAPSGTHTLRVRATGADGEVQTSDVQGPVPNGSTRPGRAHRRRHLTCRRPSHRRMRSASPCAPRMRHSVLHRRRDRLVSRLPPLPRSTAIPDLQCEGVSLGKISGTSVLRYFGTSVPTRTRSETRYRYRMRHVGTCERAHMRRDGGAGDVRAQR